MKIRLINQVSQLDGTQYFEFLPGPYKGRCFTDDSVFIEEDVFGIIEPIFQELVPKYQRNAFNKVLKEDWAKIVAEMQQQRVNIANSPNSDAELLAMIDQFTSWVIKTLGTYEEISILGI